VPSFLHPLLRSPERAWTLVDADSGVRLAAQVTAAVDSATRRRGLLGRTEMHDEALIIAPCNAVHTFFMRMAIDILFVTRDGRVTKAVQAVAPWRITASFGAFATIEMAAGTLARTGAAAGRVVAVRER
jgi:uncharacterized membrane protein (UPF0127 family)